MLHLQECSSTRGGASALSFVDYGPRGVSARLDYIVDQAQLSPCGGGALAKVMIVSSESNISSPTKAIEIAFSTCSTQAQKSGAGARRWGLDGAEPVGLGLGFEVATHQIGTRHVDLQAQEVDVSNHSRHTEHEAHQQRA